MTCRELHPNARAFAYWIFGYQNFYEPVVRAWFMDNGYETIDPRSVVGRDLAPSVASIESGDHSFSVSSKQLEHALSLLKQKAAGTRTRVQLDLLLRKDRVVYTGECKSWGGYLASVTWDAVRENIVDDDQGLFLYLNEVRGEPVAGTFLVLWKRSEEHDLIEAKMTQLFGRPIRLFYLDEIFSNPSGQTATMIDECLQLLDDAAGLVREMFHGLCGDE